MVTIKEIPTNDLVASVAQELKGIKEIKAPEWAKFVKTGVHKQHLPVDQDWWYVRAASILLKVQKLGPVGVAKLRTAYGGRKNRGVKPDKFFKASGNILRKVLQQLDAQGFTEMNENETKKGRIITSKGVSFIHAAGKKVKVEKPKSAEAKPAKPAESKKNTEEKAAKAKAPDKEAKSKEE